LQAASYVVHFDHWWNPAVMWQAEARAHRQGQKRTVNVYSYWVTDTIEEKIYQTLKAKGLLFADIVDGLSETDLDNTISTEEWLDMLGVKHKTITSPPKVTPLNLSLSQIVEKLKTIPPSDFERVVKDLLHAFGYPNTRVTGRTSDGGMDVISTRNTSDGVVRVIAQCKRYKGTVGVEIAREFMGVIASDDSVKKGYLVTTGEFTRECMAFCERSGIIVALNGSQTANYVRKFGVQI
jgi:HJR/Mrr/RecB family endonuclease